MLLVNFCSSGVSCIGLVAVHASVLSLTLFANQFECFVRVGCVQC